MSGFRPLTDGELNRELRLGSLYQSEDPAAKVRRVQFHVSDAAVEAAHQELHQQELQKEKDWEKFADPHY